MKRQFKYTVQDVYADSYFENITNTKLLEDIQKGREKTHHLLV